MYKYGPLDYAEGSVDVVYPHPFVEALDRMHAPAVFGGQDSTLCWIKNSSYEQFREWLSWMNGVVRSAPAKERGLNDTDRIFLKRPMTEGEGSQGELVNYVAPPPGTRDGLLAEAHAATGRMHDLGSISKMLAVVVAELQGFRNGNKRSSRKIYGLGTNGYYGTPQERWDYSMATYNMHPGMDVDFLFHNELANRFTKAEVLKLVGDSHDIADKLEVESIQLGAEAIGLPPLMATECYDFLNEDFFNLPLILSWVGPYGGHMRDYFSSDGKISATKVFEDLTVKKAYRLWECNTSLKVDYLRAIISSFETGDTSVFAAPIQDVIEPYFPSPHVARRRAVPIPTAALLPVFSEQPQDPWRT